MHSKYVLSALAAASLALATVPALADEASSASSSSSASSDDSQRVERCRRFSRGDDYERCVRLIRRLPARSAGSQSSSSVAGDWKWTNIYNRIDDKMLGAVKFVSTMAKQFCRAQTEETDTTQRECMARVRDDLKNRIGTMIDTAFRADLPSAR